MTHERNADGQLLYAGKVLPDGPWHDEPDHVAFEVPGGLACILHRNLSWCGYVGIPPGHPWYGKGYSDLPDVDVHGGVTYAEVGQGEICLGPGESDDLWWIGFDCLHHMDLALFDLALSGDNLGLARSGGTYRDLAYVQNETKRLANQALLAIVPE